MFKNNILATDGSGHAAKAAQTAADLAAKYGAKLIVVTVLPETMTLEKVVHMPQAGRFSQNIKDDIKHLQEVLAVSGPGVRNPFIRSVPAPNSAIAELGEEILNDAEETAKRKGVTDIARFALDGHPAEAIVAAAKKANADLIVLGTRGLSDLKGIIVGSVSHQVMHLADCPCLTVK